MQRDRLLALVEPFDLLVLREQLAESDVDSGDEPCLYPTADENGSDALRRGLDRVEPLAVS